MLRALVRGLRHGPFCGACDAISSLHKRQLIKLIGAWETEVQYLFVNAPFEPLQCRASDVWVDAGDREGKVALTLL
jgi:hypothetical protein